MPDVSSIGPKRPCRRPPATLHGVVFDIFGWEPQRRGVAARILLEAAVCPALDAGWRPVRVTKTRQIKNSPNKNRPVLPGGFAVQKSLRLLATAEASRPPPGAARLGLIRCRGGGLRRGGGRRWLRPAARDWRRCVGLGVDQEANLFAHGRAAPRGSFGFLSGFLLHGCTSRLLLTAILMRSLGRWRNGNRFGLNNRRRRLG